MADDDQDQDEDETNKKSLLADGLKTLSETQFREVSEAVHAETDRRLAEAKAKRPVHTLSDVEFTAWAKNLMERAD
jgi:hypothetical protein